jgi:hypothetical protein
MLVLDRSDKPWSASLSSRYYMYPVHVSSSFLLTRGLNSALYLLLLRLLHRAYDDAYRLTDSVASDTALNAEGATIFAALKFASDDHHPDAHACRLKVSLVTIDCGARLPWDLTTEAAKYVSKLGAVAATCLLAPEEELQLLETKHIVLDEKHDDYDPGWHDPYTRCLVKNRLMCLRATLAPSAAAVAVLSLKDATDQEDAKSSEESRASEKAVTSAGFEARGWEVSHPPRDGGSGWPYYQVWCCCFLLLRPLPLPPRPCLFTSRSFAFTSAPLP